LGSSKRRPIPEDSAVSVLLFSNHILQVWWDVPESFDRHGTYWHATTRSSLFASSRTRWFARCFLVIEVWHWEQDMCLDSEVRTTCFLPVSPSAFSGTASVYRMYSESFYEIGVWSLILRTIL
jgi:hypothetical protein